MSHTPISEEDRQAGIVYGSLVADSLALGAHWIYDQEEIRGTFGRVTDLLAPLPDSYHPKKTRGEQTHYGDQAIVLMETLREHGDFNRELFTTAWKNLWVDYPDYFDHATKETLATGSASHSEELGGAARIAPLIALMADRPLEDIIGAAREQTAVTHDSPIALDAAEFIVRITRAIFEDSTIERAVKIAAVAGYAVISPADYQKQVEETKNLETGEALQRIGLSCPAAKGLPAVLVLLDRYAHDPEAALIENVMAGGDSAARGLVLGMILGAYHGKGAVEQRWVEELKSAPRIETFLGTLD